MTPEEYLNELDFVVVCGAGQIGKAPACVRHAKHVLRLYCASQCTSVRLPLPVCTVHFLHWTGAILTCQMHGESQPPLRKVWEEL